MERTYSDEHIKTGSVYLIFGQNIQEYRKKQGRTQEELATALDCNQKYVSRLENGYARPKLDICLRIANFLQVSIDDLLDQTYSFQRTADDAKNQRCHRMMEEIGEVISRYMGEL